MRITAIRQRLFIAGLIVDLLTLFLAFDLDRFFSLEWLQAQRESLLAQRDAHPFATAAAFFAVYVLVTALSLPGAGRC